jgi:hypothetical protein
MLRRGCVGQSIAVPLYPWRAWMAGVVAADAENELGELPPPGTGGEDERGVEAASAGRQCMARPVTSG